MNSSKKYDKLIESLREVNPEIQSRDELVRTIMEKTASGGSGFDFVKYIFGWTDYPVVRKVAIAFSIMVVSVFAFQQLVIMNRIDNLESRMVESNTEQLLQHHERSVLLNSAILMNTNNSESLDSILVADKDLRILVDSYLKLQKQSQDLQNLYDEGSKRKL